MTTNYQELLKEAFDRFSVLFQEREEIDVELLKLRQFIYATINMLPESERNIYQAELAELAAQAGGLTDAVRESLKLATQRQTYFSTAEVRDHLVKAGFDFSRYTSNPLASVNTILRRFKPGEVETTTVEGVTAYRWIARFPRSKWTASKFSREESKWTKER